MARAAKLDLRAFQQEAGHAALAARPRRRSSQSRLGIAVRRRAMADPACRRGRSDRGPADGARVPLTKPWYLGIVEHSRQPLRRDRFRAVSRPARSSRSRPAQSQTRLVLFGPRGGELHAGLDRAARARPAQSGGAVAQRYAGRCAGLVRRSAGSEANGDVWQEIDLARLAQDPAFLQVGL